MIFIAAELPWFFVPANHSQRWTQRKSMWIAHDWHKWVVSSEIYRHRRNLQNQIYLWLQARTHTLTHSELWVTLPTNFVLFQNTIAEDAGGESFHGIGTDHHHVTDFRCRGTAAILQYNIQRIRSSTSLVQLQTCGHSAIYSFWLLLEISQKLYSFVFVQEMAQQQWNSYAILISSY